MYFHGGSYFIISNILTNYIFLLILFQVETLVCLLPDVKEVYWPTERREPLKILKTLEVTLQSTKNEIFWTEKIFTLLNKETNTSRVVIHLQLNPNVRLCFGIRKRNSSCYKGPSRNDVTDSCCNCTKALTIKSMAMGVGGQNWLTFVA